MGKVSTGETKMLLGNLHNENKVKYSLLYDFGRPMYYFIGRVQNYKQDPA